MAETIRDYLVSLGFKVEKGQEARFNDTLGSLAKTATVVAASLTAAAAAIAASVVKIAAEFDTLYFAAQRSNTSVAQIRSLSYALSQVGGSAGQAQTAIDAVATALRTNPGAEGFLNSIGVATRENGRLKDTAEIIDGMVKSLSKQPYYVGSQMAGILGIDEKTFQVLQTQWPKIQAFQEEYRRQAAELGVDPDKAAAGANKLMTSFRDMSMTIGLVADKITMELQPILSQYLKDFGDWVKSHAGEIKDAILAIMAAFKGLAEDVVGLAAALKPVVERVVSLTMALTGEKDGLKAAFEAVLLFVAGIWLTRMLAALATLSANPAFVALAALAGITLAAAGSSTATVEAGTNLRLGMRPGQKKSGLKEWWDGLWGRGGPQKSGGSDKSSGLDPVFKERLDKMIAEAPENIRNAIGITSGYRSVAEQTRLWEDALKKYGSAAEARKWVAPPGKSAHNTGEAADLRFDTPEARQWAHENAGRFGLEFKLGNEPWHTTPIKDPDYLKRARENHSAVFGGNGFALMGGASRSVTIEQRTNIAINGSTDPAGTGAALQRGQSRINADLLGNARSAFT